MTTRRDTIGPLPDDYFENDAATPPANKGAPSPYSHETRQRITDEIAKNAEKAKKLIAERDKR